MLLKHKLINTYKTLDNYDIYGIITSDIKYAGMVELADTQDLGSCAASVQVRPLLPAPDRTVFISVLLLFYEISDNSNTIDVIF